MKTNDCNDQSIEPRLGTSCPETYQSARIKRVVNIKPMILLVLICALLFSCNSCTDKKITNPEDTILSPPEFSPAAGEYYEDQEVTITCPSSDAIIHYTTDGSDPTEESPIYDNPILVSVNTVIKARALKQDWEPSTIAEAEYELTVPNPEFDPPGGAYDIYKDVIISCATSDAIIYYSTDGSMPNIRYRNPVLIIPPKTLKARATKTGWNDSQIISEDYAAQQVVKTPTFHPWGGGFSSSVDVALACATPGADIYYSTDNSPPTTLYTGPMTISTQTSITAQAKKEGWIDSQILRQTYGFRPEKPTFNPPGGAYSSSQQVTIDCATSNTAIYYTLDGSNPTEASARYTGPVTINETAVIKARAFVSGWEPSLPGHAPFAIMTPDQMVYVQGGTFHNGTSDVTLSSFYMSKYEVTRTELHAVLELTYTDFMYHPRLALDEVSWFIAILFCNKRSIHEGLTPCYSYGAYGTDPSNWPTGWNLDASNHSKISCSWTANGYRLPTEMEWMYAARGGLYSHDYTYSGSNVPYEVAWYLGNSDETVHQIGILLPNELGIFDMSGNVGEWCWDIYGDYPSEPQNNPHGAISGSNRLVRGGAWCYNSNYCKVDYRYENPATASYIGFGFRCVRNSF